MTFQESGADSQTLPSSPSQQPQASTYNQPQAPTPKQSRNVLALIAFIVAIVGFIFACIPGALIIGWILLPIGFILAIVSLFLRGSGKGLGIAGLIISVVGTVVAFIVFFAVVTTSFDEAFGDESAVVKEPVEAGQAPTEDALAEEPATAKGTRENPVAIGSTITTENWTVVVNSYSTDGNSIVLANEFNDPAPAGSHYEVVNYTVKYTGEDSALAAEVGIDVVTSAGNVVNSYDNFVVLDDGGGVDELFNGASATESAAYVVPDGQSVQVRVRPGMMADEVFVKP